jgi:outer membrane immunogenic protein
MKKVVLAALFLLLATVLPAAAQGPYVGVAGGLNIVHDSDVDTPLGSGEIEYDYGFGFNVTGGMHFAPIRLELEFGYNQADVDDGGDADLTIMSYMLNGYYDMAMGTAPISPFLGFGLGFINGEFDGIGGEDDDTVFGYQATVGVTSHLNQYLDLDVYYRFQSTFDDFEIEDADVEYSASLIFAGLRYHF